MDNDNAYFLNGGQSSVDRDRFFDCSNHCIRHTLARVAIRPRKLAVTDRYIHASRARQYLDVPGWIARRRCNRALQLIPAAVQPRSGTPAIPHAPAATQSIPKISSLGTLA